MSKPLISKSKQKEIALERIKILFKEADEVFPKNKSLAGTVMSLFSQKDSYESTPPFSFGIKTPLLQALL